MAERWRSPFASSEAIKRRMSTQLREGTAPELALRQALHAHGLRYRLHRAPLPGLRRKADIVFGPARVAVFVDGCFWHGCPEHGKRHHRVNGWYWPDKITRNQDRDRDTNESLGKAGWAVVRVWEHEVSSAPAATVVAAQLGELVRRRRNRPGTGPQRAVSAQQDRAQRP